ncbi:MAG: T9SS type A sorting domain-containing protein [Flavobacteriales bacterium]|nr:T9SS type A sorting domain-containing protein [Flavobacteriales bacterium]
MRRLLHTSVLAIAFPALCGAQILNPGFETWANIQSCQNPANWGTLNGSTAILGICTAQRETQNVHGGASALRLSTEFIGFPVNQTAPGIVTNGTINTQTEAVEGGHTFTDRPVALTGWYMAAPLNGDEYSFSALFINQTNGDTIGRAEWAGTATVTEWTMFTATVEWLSADPHGMLQIILLPSNSGNPQVGSVAHFDDMGVVMEDPTGIATQQHGIIRAYPNPATDRLFFHVGSSDLADVALFNMLGSKVAEARLTATAHAMDVSHLPAGTYFWQMATVKGEPLHTGKVMVQR